MSKGKRYFGTDGIRGKANTGLLTEQNLTRLGHAIAIYLKENAHSPVQQVALGWDTRGSGEMIRAVLASGLNAGGCTVVMCGVIPTPGLADATHRIGAEIGIMITASHNPYQDNGIKLFASTGQKLSDDAQIAIEDIFDRDMPETPTQTGDIKDHPKAQTDYIDMLLGSLPDGFSLSGLKLVVDCANGAGYDVAPRVFERLEPDRLELIGVSPDGRNINLDCGSTHPERLSETVTKTGADVGLAFDGDADRLIMCDETGQVTDGDQLLAFLTRGWQAQGRLKGGALVATVMSNLGLERYVSKQGISLIRTRVGDRHVAAKMRKLGCNLGGEQSGHILMTDFGPSGDGVLAALHVLVELKRLNRPASEALNVFETVPQKLVNVRYNGHSPMGSQGMKTAVQGAEHAIGDGGRILVRASGTEPLIRVMVEGDDPDRVEGVIERLAKEIQHLTTGVS